MPFNELNAERKIGGKEAPKDIEAIKKELKERAPELLEILKQEMENTRKYTDQQKEKLLQEKEKYPGLFESLEYLKGYSEAAGFKEILISPRRGTRMEVQPLFNLIIIEESYLPIIKKLKEFAPDFLDKALKHTLGNIKQEISGHEAEH